MTKSHFEFGDARLPDRFWEKVAPEPMSGCWIWFGATLPKGYATLRTRSQGLDTTHLAHRFFYKALVGEIGIGLQLDHLCRVRCCVNPDHLEPVTQQENIRRGEAGLKSGAQQRAKTHCPRGHAYDEANTHYGRTATGIRSRSCKKCMCASEARYRARKRAKKIARGERVGKGRKLTEEIAEAIRARFSAGERAVELGAVYGISPAMVRNVARGDSWPQPQPKAVLS